MIAIARQTDLHTCLIPIHSVTPIVPIGGTVYVNGIPVARVGDMTGCGAVIVSGFPHILVNGRPMAHVGSLTSHGGSIVTGSDDCVGGEVNFMTSKLVVDFGKLGAVREDGAVDEELMAELLSDTKLEERARAAEALVQDNNGTPPAGKSFFRSIVVTDKETGQLLPHRKFLIEMDGRLTRGSTDANGLADIETRSPGASFFIHVLLEAPAIGLTELSESAQYTARDFKTTVGIPTLEPGQRPAPEVIFVDDRATAREAIISMVRLHGHEFVERSGWKANAPKRPLEKDWNYSMIALHHAGRSYSCGTDIGTGAEQMRATQMTQFNKDYDDISYHFGIDCSGNIYEGRDIRHKGASVLKYNTGVIGIVLLNNLTTHEEGEDLVAFARSAMKNAGINTTSQIHASQRKALLTLIEALRKIFIIKHFGGHKEFPNQEADGKICPGNIAMVAVEEIRAQIKLTAPSPL
jgi:uncharacterized Zn-binding protein involved in type VI secretion